MADVVWTEPAIADLDAIADYIAFDNPKAARKLVSHIFKHSAQLENHPKIGAKLPEYKSWRYRQIIEPPCRIIYRQEQDTVYIIHVMRSEQLLKRGKLHRQKTES